VFAPSQYLINHPGQLSLANPLWVGSMSISDSTRRVVPSTFVVARLNRLLFGWYMVFHRAQCLGRSCSSCIQLLRNCSTLN